MRNLSVLHVRKGKSWILVWMDWIRIAKMF
jgi:hypothetical protein